MEFDSQSQCSDELAENSVSEHEELYSDTDTNMDDNQPIIMEAKVVYLLMPKNIPISRAKRLQWLLDHLNTVITVHKLDPFTHVSNRTEVVSAIPMQKNAAPCNRFLITFRTEVKIFARRYRYVYCFDMSPSQSNIDIQRGEILFDEILSCFKASVEGLTKEFTIPSSSIVFKPIIYLTVMVNTPFFMSPAQQVLVKGVRLTSDNINEIIMYIEEQFHLLEGKIADVAALALDQIEFQRVQNERIVGGLFDLPESDKSSKIPMVTPDANFVNMLRYSMLAISLLPENSLSHILVITDGIVAMPDSNIMESLLFQLHYDSIGVSFLKVGSSFYPQTSAGYVAYTDLLYFFAHSTLGTCLESFPTFTTETSTMNLYHELFLIWSFHSVNKYYSTKVNDKWCSTNRPPSLLSKRQSDENTSASLILLLSRRMREGFTVDNFNLIDGNLEVKLSLQWKSFIYIQYKVSSQWPIVKNLTRFEVFISAPYEFLYDITCTTKETKSICRQAIIDRFWIRLTQLSSLDLGLAQQISSFQYNKDWYALPESVKNGVPVYILSSFAYSDHSKLALTPRDNACSKFVGIWQPICQMETSNWRRWLHVHKVSLILKHDNPLPKYLHLANSSQRFQVVQCRQAATALYKMLVEWATFILIDNHTYLKLLYVANDKCPDSFCMVRVSSKFPCAVLNIGFATNTPGQLRLKMCEELKSDLSILSYLSSPVKINENICCVLLQKPLEKILIRYERVPNDFTTVIFPDGTQPPHSTLNLPSPTTGSLFTTLSRYLYHKRWIWSASHPINPRLPDIALSRILQTLTRMRLNEGFSFAFSSSGIITMVLELEMSPCRSCIVQYVLFPPHSAKWNIEDMLSGSDEEIELFEFSSELQMVTEVWIEPHYGTVVADNPRVQYFHDIPYYQIADVISELDAKCINALITVEHLSLMCQMKKAEATNPNLSFNQLKYNNRKLMLRKNSRSNFLDASFVPDRKGSQWYAIVTPRIEHIPFNFDPISILSLCQKSELLFSMFIETNDNSFNNASKSPNKLLLNNLLYDLSILNDKEFELSADDSDRFSKLMLTRHLNKWPNICPISQNFHRPYPEDDDDEDCPISQWRCFLKGISMTHVILTFIPSSVENLRSLVLPEFNNSPNLSDSATLGGDRASSRCSNFSDVHINVPNSMCLPVYVFDCPLAIFVNAYINNLSSENCGSRKDVYEDHRHKSASDFEVESVRLKDDGTNGKSDENEPSCVKKHCKTLVLTHLKCFTVNMFIALYSDIYVHSYDVQSAMDQCDEAIMEIDITDYILTVCGHAKRNNEDKIPLQHLHEALPCSEIKPLHTLIKEKFFKLIASSFKPIPSNTEFYYYRNLLNTLDDSDDEIAENIIEFKENEYNTFHRLGSCISDVINSEVNPLFLNLICTLKYNNGHSNTCVRVLPTCLGELIQNLESTTSCIDKTKLQVTLDILCLTLPHEVQNILADYSTQGLRTTSFCSDGFQPSVCSFTSDASFNSDIPEFLIHLPDHQRRSVIYLRDEIKWLLQDEIATALLDKEPVTSDTLTFVMAHVTDGDNSINNTTIDSRKSCILKRINLKFVYESLQSHDKFVKEFSQMQLPFYKLCKHDQVYYLAKKSEKQTSSKERKESGCYVHSNIESNLRMNGDKEIENNNEINVNISSLFDDASENCNNCDKFRDEMGSIQSDISSINSALGTDGGYDEDVSEDYEDFEWLINLNEKRTHLPNFWLIMKIDQEDVTIYFHCRFLELRTSYVDEYLDVQRSVCDEIKKLCKKVNQLLLLQSLYKTKVCDILLESDDYAKDFSNESSSSSISRNASYSRLKSMDDSNEESEVMGYSASLSEASLNYKAGHFSCPVVWETEFELNPRLKTSLNKSGLSRGILALKNVLERFSVSNRNNMFVCTDHNLNVFYLRLHENVHFSNKGSSLRPNEYESAIVSRSPSIASLPLGQNKSNLTQSEQSISSVLSGDIRPRVRSFGEKESKDGPNEDTLILKVHGITEAGTDIQCDLVQVLQNRLDDAVLESLSIMLVRNVMCPLTPSDVQFIQKPFRLPEIVVKLSIQDYALQYIDSFIHYLKQNLLQFLNIPKYTDTRAHSHFEDYSETEEGNSRIGKDNIFVFNQSTTSGSRGIACIALAITYSEGNKVVDFQSYIKNIFKTGQFETAIMSSIILNYETLPPNYIEFRIWKQGRVNEENLSKKLRAAVSQATWDIVTEYYLLKFPLCEDNFHPTSYSHKAIEISNNLDLSREVEFNCILEFNTQKNVKQTVASNFKRKIDVDFIPRKRNCSIPLNSKVNRSITFEDCEKEKKLANFRTKQKMQFIKNNAFECGDDGMLCDIYSKHLSDWFEFGNALNAPAIKKKVIPLISRHLPNTPVKELLNLLQDSPKAYCAIPSHCLKSENNDIFVPNKSRNLGQKYIIISRDFNHWKISVTTSDTSDYPESMSPNTLKHIQKFVPAVVNNYYIPRQRILWLLVENDGIVIYTYNWAKDNIDKLIGNCTNLGQWLCVRSCFLNSVTSQKLGLFHNQPLTRKCFMMDKNPYANYIGDIDYTKDFQRDHSRKRSPPTHDLLSSLETFRDSFHNSKYATADPAVVFTIDIREMKAAEKRSREEMQNLNSMYQSRTNTTTVPQIYLLLQNSRILHYCHTPLLFLPRWRLKSASTRDHSLYPSQAIKMAQKLPTEEKWHTELCYNFFSDYRHYLQTLGFMSLQIDNPQREFGSWKDKSAYNSMFFIQKTILGGILLFTIEFSEPFFVTKLHAIECNRLQNIRSRTSINRFTLSFLDECDRVKILMHLHSFTYDYHLRCMYNYISNNNGVNKICERYNVYQFLDDFLKYYNKAPNFARNLVHTDTITINNLVTEGKQLFDYLLSNVDQYDFKVCEMDLYENESDFILVQVTSTPQVSYKDSQDRHHTDDFDITLVVYNICAPYSPTDNILHLKYYLILTSKREIYPKSEVEHKLGKFRTVSCTSRSLSALERTSTELESSIVKMESDTEMTSSDEHLTFSSDNNSEGTINNVASSVNHSTSIPHVEICQESVNYLGYYSSHEQLMQQLILDKAHTTQNHIKDMVAKGNYSLFLVNIYYLLLQFSLPNLLAIKLTTCMILSVPIFNYATIFLRID